MKPNLIQPLLNRLRRSIDRKWLVVFLGFLAALDAFVLVIPIEALLVPCILLRPAQWKKLAFGVALGSALGASALAELARIYGYRLLERLSPSFLHSTSWDKAQHYVTHYGAWGLSFIAWSPIPQQAAVAWAGLSHVAIPTIFFAVLLGRQIKYMTVAAIAAYAPAKLRIFGIKARPSSASRKS